MLYHSVLFAFADEVTDDEITGVLSRLQAMEAIPAVQSIAVGRNLMPVSQGWDFGMTIVFENRTAMMEDFGPHPLHQAVLRDDVPRFSRHSSLDVSTDQ